MNILYIDHYAGSESMGMEFRPYYMAREWQRMGHNVTIIAADCSHLRAKNPVIDSDFQDEEVDGVNFCWVKTPQYATSLSVGRYKNVYSFVEKLEQNAQMLADKYKPDAVIASSTYPMDIYPAKKIADLNKAKLCFEIHDIWPLTLIVIYKFPKWLFLIKNMQRAEDFALRESNLVVSVLPHAGKHMIERGFSDDKMAYIPNGIILDTEHEKMPCEHKEIFEKLKKEGKFIVLYAGGHTSTNELGTLIKSSKFMPENVQIVLVGDGRLKNKLIKYAKRRNLENVTFLPKVKKTQVFDVLEQGDCLYVGAKKCELYQYGVGMNKIYDYMMAAKPIIYGIEASNDIVADCNCGVTIPTGDPQAIAGAVSDLMNISKDERAEMGARGCEYVKKYHDYKFLASEFIKNLQG